VFEYILGLGIFALLILLIGLLVAIAISGFFVWVALKIVGENRGIIEAGIANIVAGFVSGIAMGIVMFIPLLNLFAPILAFFVYVYVLSSMLRIDFLKGVAVAIISYLVFAVIASLAGMFAGIPVYQMYHPARFRGPF